MFTSIWATAAVFIIIVHGSESKPEPGPGPEPKPEFDVGDDVASPESALHCERKTADEE